MFPLQSRKSLNENGVPSHNSAHHFGLFCKTSAKEMAMDSAGYLLIPLRKTAVEEACAFPSPSSRLVSEHVIIPSHPLILASASRKVSTSVPTPAPNSQEPSELAGSGDVAAGCCADARVQTALPLKGMVLGATTTSHFSSDFYPHIILEGILVTSFYGSLLLLPALLSICSFSPSTAI